MCLTNPKQRRSQGGIRQTGMSVRCFGCRGPRCVTSSDPVISGFWNEHSVTLRVLQRPIRATGRHTCEARFLSASLRLALPNPRTGGAHPGGGFRPGIVDGESGVIRVKRQYYSVAGTTRDCAGKWLRERKLRMTRVYTIDRLRALIATN